MKYYHCSRPVSAKSYSNSNIKSSNSTNFIHIMNYKNAVSDYKENYCNFT